MRRLFNSFPLSFGKTAIIYPMILAVALILAQSVKMAASYILFLFVLLLPTISLVQLLTARFCISAHIRLSDSTVKKNSPLRVLVSVKNSSPLPFSTVRAVLTLPDQDKVSCTESHIIFSLIPFSHCRIERNAIFALRGEYEIALAELWASDVFRAVNIKIPVKASGKVLVLPRIFQLPEETAPKTVSPGNPIPRPGDSRMQGEPENIRIYERGDSPKSIHWKLSSKSEDILVKELSGEDRPAVKIFCDLEKDANEDEFSSLMHADLVIEGAIAVCRRELSLGKGSVISWLSDDGPTFLPVRSEAELMENMPTLCRIKPSPLSDHPTVLCRDPRLPKGPAVFAAAHMGEEKVKNYLVAADRNAELVLCRSKAEKDSAESTVNRGLNALSSAGVRITEFTAP